MASPKRCLLQASGDDTGHHMNALELIAHHGLQLPQIVGVEVGQRVALEPDPHVFDWIGIGCIEWQECDLDLSALADRVLVLQGAAVRLQALPDCQPRAGLALSERLVSCFACFSDNFLVGQVEAICG